MATILVSVDNPLLGIAFMPDGRGRGLIDSSRTSNRLLATAPKEGIIPASVHRRMRWRIPIGSESFWVVYSQVW